MGFGGGGGGGGGRARVNLPFSVCLSKWGLKRKKMLLFIFFLH